MLIKVLPCDTTHFVIIAICCIVLNWIFDIISFHIHFYHDISFPYFLWHDTEDCWLLPVVTPILFSLYLEKRWEIKNEKCPLRIFWFYIHPTFSLLRTSFTTRLVNNIQLYIYVCYLKVKSKCLKTYIQIGFYKIRFIKLKSIGIKGLF